MADTIFHSTELQQLTLKIKILINALESITEDDYDVIRIFDKDYSIKLSDSTNTIETSHHQTLIEEFLEKRQQLKSLLMN